MSRSVSPLSPFPNPYCLDPVFFFLSFLIQILSLIILFHLYGYHPFFPPLATVIWATHLYLLISAPYWIADPVGWWPSLCCPCVERISLESILFAISPIAIARRTPDPVRGPASSLCLSPQTDTPVILIHNPFLSIFVSCNIRSTITIIIIQRSIPTFLDVLVCWYLGHSHACNVWVKIKPPWMAQFQFQCPWPPSPCNITFKYKIRGYAWSVVRLCLAVHWPGKISTSIETNMKRRKE